MEIIRDIAHLREKSFPHVAAAIGTFDGVHVGHQRIILQSSGELESVEGPGRPSPL